MEPRRNKGTTESVPSARRVLHERQETVATRGLAQDERRDGRDLPRKGVKFSEKATECSGGRLREFHEDRPRRARTCRRPLMRKRAERSGPTAGERRADLRLVRKSRANRRQSRRKESTAGVEVDGAIHTCNDGDQLVNGIKFLTTTSAPRSPQSHRRRMSKQAAQCLDPPGAALERVFEFDMPVVEQR